MSASGKRRDCDFQLLDLGRKWCLHGKSQMWKWRGNNCLLFLHHLIEEQLHNKQNEALSHPIHGAVVELIATRRGRGLKHKKDDIMLQRRGAYQIGP